MEKNRFSQNRAAGGFGKTDWSGRGEKGRTGRMAAAGQPRNACCVHGCSRFRQGAKAVFHHKNPTREGNEPETGNFIQFALDF
jgi:hypothetical protein